MVQHLCPSSLRNKHICLVIDACRSNISASAGPPGRGGGGSRGPGGGAYLAFISWCEANAAPSRCVVVRCAHHEPDAYFTPSRMYGMEWSTTKILEHYYISNMYLLPPTTSRKRRKKRHRTTTKKHTHIFRGIVRDNWWGTRPKTHGCAAVEDNTHLYLFALWGWEKKTAERTLRLIG